ncbi:MAG: M42 family metallopeptidase [Brotaphodocola sp.]
MADLKTIEDLSNAFGPSGFEEEVVKVIQKHCEGLDLKNDAMHNVYATMPGEKNSKPIFMLDAHTDECGFMVQNIEDNGLLSIIMLGGFHMTSLPAHTVIIRNQKGEKIRGIITSKPIHFLNEAQRADNSLSFDEIKVDVGASSRQEVMEDYGIRIGDPMMPEVKFEYDEKHGICFGKAFDNRMGCMCIIETMKRLLAEADDLAVNVVGAFAAQEESGMRGATVTAQQVKPDLAIVFEGSPADDFYYREGVAQSSLKKGVQIRCMDKSYISNPVFIQYAHEIGEKYGIKYQDTVRRGGSTDAGKISLTNQAVPVLVLGIPSRYVHTHYNFCAAEDIESTIRMAVEVIRGLDEEKIRHIRRQDIL